MPIASGKRPLIGFSLYDPFTAEMVRDIDEVDFIVIGDSLGMVFKRGSVRDTRLGDSLYHLRAVLSVIRDKPIYVDLPIGTYEEPGRAVENSRRVVEEGGYGVVVEGYWPRTWDALARAGIPYIVHLGYTPKYMDRPRVVRGDEGAKLLEMAREAEYRGAEMVKLELVETGIAGRIAEELEIPVIGVGAGPNVDGHILVIYDFLGLYPGFTPKFVKRYVDLIEIGRKGVESLVRDILTGRYPGPEESY